MRSRLLAQIGATSTLLLAFAACDAPAPTSLPSNPATETYAASLNIDISKMTKLDGPLYILDNPVGTGAVAATGKTITVAYSGFLVDGEEFDSSNSFTLTLGTTSVIQGWTNGLPGMKVGGKRTLVIGSADGYGASGTSDIPPNTTLVFFVQLLSVQ